MEINQGTTEFEPITITLKTRGEAFAFWAIVAGYRDPSVIETDPKLEQARLMSLSLDNWLSNNCKGL
jgi:hypothetical protein